MRLHSCILFCVCFLIFCFQILSLLSRQQDPSNLQGKVQKHQAFEAELSANQSRIDALQKSGQELLDGKHYASTEVSGHMEEVSSQWKKLLEATELKGTVWTKREHKIGFEPRAVAKYMKSPRIIKEHNWVLINI